MRLKLLYTLILIFCMSAFASSKKECTHPMADSAPVKKVDPIKDVKEEFSTFQFVKFLYI